MNDNCTSRPVHDTLDHFLEHSQFQSFARFCIQMAQRLVHMEILDQFVPTGFWVVNSIKHFHLAP